MTAQPFACRWISWKTALPSARTIPNKAKPKWQVVSKLEGFDPNRSTGNSRDIPNNLVQLQVQYFVH